MLIHLPSLVFLNQNCTPCLHVGSTLSAATLTVHHVLLSSASVLTRGIMIHAHAQACMRTLLCVSIVCMHGRILLDIGKYMTPT